ncbi:TonB-dependent receptor [Alloalcanivorax profundimaris]|uniref:TonB-dependent receptor n=1 Tax=Alloalcanivorax profundimaris TaxID=2735259 RepID=UPI000C3C2B4A|nr:TonB-dependent receptor [Alloalcanivorax profundimaris]MBF1802958.1 TonB-dependent receptor [Alloalcanivorax profundimaris]MBU59578.1 TonB-dependent receptor [Alcanivorax sp.]
MFKKTLLATLVGLAAGQAAWAQQAGDGNEETVKVIGQAASMDKALASQRAADNIETTVNADAIGQFPDSNVSESLQRLPGVSIERDQGEGRFVRVRGLAPDLNAVNVNGIQVPAPESDRRAVALDVIPSELLESLTVVKSLTPDMDANSLGGTVEVNSLSAFDRDGLYYSVSGQAGYDEHSEETSPELSAAASNRFDLGDGQDNFGVAAAISWAERDFGSDNVETGGAWDFDGDTPRLEEFEQRDYTITRERLGMALNLDYRPDDNTSYYLRTLHSRFRDQEVRQATIYGFDSAQAAGETGLTEVEKELKNREETQEITSLVFGGKKRWDRWIMEYNLGYSEASEEEPRHTDGAVFVAELPNGGFTDSRQPNALHPDGFFDDGNYELDEVEVASGDTEDNQTDLKLDFTRELLWNNNPASIKFGTKMARRDKEGDVNVWTYEPDGNLADFRTDVDYELGDIGSGIDPDAMDNALSGPGEFDAEASAIEDYKISEDRDAAYVMGTVDFEKLRLLGGVRYQRTDFEARGNGVEDGTLVTNDYDESEDHWLPALHLRYQLGRDTIARAAFTQSVVRPTFEQLSPGFEIDGDEASFGNPELKSLEANNFDLGIEHYMGRAGVISAFAFYKDIDNFAYLTDLGGSPGYEAFSDAETFDNGSDASVYGLELSYSKQFNELPAPFNGLLVGANATFVDSEATIESYDDDAGAYSRRDIPLPSQSDVTGNLVFGYETPRLSLRLAANYTGEFLQEVSDPLDDRYDIYTDDHVQLDFTGHYFLTEQLQLTFEAININDEPFYAYTGKERFNAQYEEYGPTYKLGLSLKHF